jgi:hypothetical protein
MTDAAFCFLCVLRVCGEAVVLKASDGAQWRRTIELGGRNKIGSLSH